MNLYPKLYIDNVTSITYEMLQQNNIKGLILDVDNTLIDYENNMLKGVEQWCEELKEKGIKFCIASNNHKGKKIKEVAEKLGIEYIFFARKPLKVGLNKASKKMTLSNNEIAVIGDQIFTDILGANRCKMFSILIEPIEERDIFITRIKRPIENIIKKNYQNNQNNTKGEREI